MKTKLLLLFLLGFLHYSCNDVNPDDADSDFFKVSKVEIAFDYKVGVDTIKLETSTNWKIDEIPEWLSVNKQQGTKDDKYIVVSSKRNVESTKRNFDLVIRITNKQEKITIYQLGKPEVEYTLPRLGFSSLSRLVSGTYAESAPFDLEFEASALFVHASNKELIFPGSLFAGNISHHPKLERIQADDITYIPTTIGIGIPPFYTEKDNFIPSYEEYSKLEKETIDKAVGNSILGIQTSNGEYYYSRRHLHCIGLYELGTALDELLGGKSYKEEGMKHEYGLLYPLSKVRFNAVMDLPNPSLLTKELDKEKYAALQPSYISSINYGNNSLLLVESDFDKATVNSLMSKLTRLEKLDAKELEKVEQIDAYYIYLESVGKFSVNKGNLKEIIERFADMKEYPIVPISFDMADYFTNGVGLVKYKIHVE